MKQIHISQKTVDKRIRRVVVNILRRADLLDSAGIHDGDTIGHFKRFFLIVRYKNAGDIDFIMQSPQPGPKFAADAGIERAEWFIEQKHFGFDSQRAGQSDALALTSGKLRRIAFGDPIQLNQFEKRHDTFANIFFRLADSLGAARAGQKRRFP